MRRHFFRRFQKRFGTELTLNQYENFKAQIKRGESTPIWKESNSRKWHIVQVFGTNLKIIVIYNHLKKEFHTCLPLDWLNREINRFKISELVKEDDAFLKF